LELQKRKKRFSKRILRKQDFGIYIFLGNSFQMYIRFFIIVIFFHVSLASKASEIRRDMDQLRSDVKSLQMLLETQANELKEKSNDVNILDRTARELSDRATNLIVKLISFLAVFYICSYPFITLRRNPRY